MIIDLESSLPARHYDLCIIGAGAAGISIAREFDGTGYSVIVLEGGGKEVEEESQEPYRSEIVGQPHKGVHSGRFRALGGSTTRWAAQALPLFDIDFESREWVPNSGWPITREQLSPYYLRAESVMQLPHATYDLSTWPRSELPEECDSEPIHCCYSQFAKEPNFVTKYGQQLSASKNIAVLLHANVVSLDASPNAESTRAANVISFSRKTARIEARYFVICCGGIDSARLLLASNSVEQQGIGNRFDTVGRYFQDHPTVTIPIKPRNPNDFDSRYGPVRGKSSLNMIKFYPTANFQRSRQILNVGAEVVHAESSDAPVASAARLIRGLRRLRVEGDFSRDLINVTRNPTEIVAAATRRLLGRRSRSSRHLRHELLVSCEQNPTPDSRITISRDTDSLGMPKTVINWRITELVSKTIEVFINEIATKWHSVQVADVDVNNVKLLGREDGLFGGYSDFNHHIGTTRMGEDPRLSVVDSDCRVHGYDNLFIASSSVFPTGSFSNPTLTILALSYRIADEIRLRLAALTSV